MVAGGTNRGNITIFQIHRPLEPTLKTTAKEKNKQIERFTINGLHTGAVTNIEWSQNGMKLFSGDKNGLVVLTEIDFYMVMFSPLFTLNEDLLNAMPVFFFIKTSLHLFLIKIFALNLQL